MRKTYRIAGIGITVDCGRDWRNPEKDFLEVFADPGTDADYEVSIGFAESFPPPEGELVFRDLEKLVFCWGDEEIRYIGPVEQGWEQAYIRTQSMGSRVTAQVLDSSAGGGITSRVVMSAMNAEHMITRGKGFLLHCSYIVRDGQAILFTAPSGTGKSTQAELWCRLRGAELINGDRAAIRLEGGQVLACGVPFAGSSRVCRNVTVPVGAIVYLSQAPRTEITRLKGLRAFRQVWEGCSVNVWNRRDMEICTQTVMTAVSAVPVYHLACTPDESAVKALEAALECGR